VAVFTGGSLLYGATGGPDRLGKGHTHDLVHAQYASAHRLATELPDATEVFPTIDRPGTRHKRCPSPSANSKITSQSCPSTD
jgi:hypothetical protein